ncbi:MAG TPA: hypothetical protein PKD17_17030, partial [Cellvibrionaceae bacterium]|nr:hypothetical protein [Cellvibrionaceae bacterium]
FWSLKNFRHDFNQESRSPDIVFYATTHWATDNLQADLCGALQSVKFKKCFQNRLNYLLASPPRPHFIGGKQGSICYHCMSASSESPDTHYQISTRNV